MEKQKLNETLKSIADSYKLLKDEGIIRSKVMVGDLGEYYCQEFGLVELVSNKVNEGFDGINESGKKVQIKTRTTPGNSAKIWLRKRNFEELMYVELNEYYQPTLIFSVEVELVEKNLNGRKDGISVGKLKKLERIETYFKK